MAFDLPGTKQIERTTNLPSSTTTFTWCAWVKFDSFTGTPVLFDFGENNNSGTCLEIYCETNGTISLWNGSATGAGSVLSTGTWYHLAITCAGTGGTDLKLYVNGSVVASMAGVSHTASVVTIGGWPGDSQWFDGKIEAAKLFNAVLSAGEISTESTYINSPYSAASVKAWIPGEPEGTFLDDQSGNGAFTEVGTGSITFIAGQSLPTYVAAGNGYYYMRNQ